MLQNVASIREAGRSWSVSAEREAAAQNLFAGMTLMRPEKSPSFSNGSRLSVRDGRGADGIKF